MSELGQLECRISLLTLNEIATPEILPPVHNSILKFKVQQEYAASGKAYKNVYSKENLA